MDLTAMDKFKKDRLDRLCFMKLFYESIIDSCDESNIITIDKKIMKYFKTRNFQLDKIESLDKIPIPIIKSEEDCAKFTSYVMDLPQQIYDDHKEQLKVF